MLRTVRATVPRHRWSRSLKSKLAQLVTHSRKHLMVHHDFCASTTGSSAAAADLGVDTDQPCDHCHEAMGSQPTQRLWCKRCGFTCHPLCAAIAPLQCANSAVPPAGTKKLPIISQGPYASRHRTSSSSATLSSSQYPTASTTAQQASARLDLGILRHRAQAGHAPTQVTFITRPPSGAAAERDNLSNESQPSSLTSAHSSPLLSPRQRLDRPRTDAPYASPTSRSESQSSPTPSSPSRSSLSGGSADSTVRLLQPATHTTATNLTLDLPTSLHKRRLGEEDDTYPIIERQSLVDAYFQNLHHLHTAYDSQTHTLTDPPALNLFTTTPRNISQFIGKIGPVVDAFYFAVDIITWKDTYRSLQFLIAFIVICLQPALVSLVPPLTVIGVIVRNYYCSVVLHGGPESQSVPDTSGDEARLTSQQPASSSSSASKSPNAATDRDRNRNTTKARSLFLSSKVYTTGGRSTATQYARNMQFIQNAMGLYCQADAVASDLYQLLDWSDPPTTWRVLWSVAGQIPFVAFIFWLVPANLLTLSAGVAFMLSNTLWAQALVVTLKPWTIRCAHTTRDQLLVGQRFVKTWWQHGLRRARNLPIGLNTAHSASSSPSHLPATPYGGLDQHQHHDHRIRSNSASSSMVTAVDERHHPIASVAVTVFENQRWWAGLGWVPRLLQVERSAWSDQTGKITARSKDDLAPPPGFVWKTTEPWEVVRDWLPGIAPDPQGWVYTDNHWRHPRSASGMLMFTRCRKWTRSALPPYNTTRHASTDAS
ncbi:hypothetical protein H4R34_003966 [Dimargaris verticillata]|uniref:Phorbol-ester/DAG-type domain-containing protein n=1 Tax=Dimargaris verticillata TaxID=2761393 RepID=A0A9W8ECN4_9FUNG|nr:hypothetical protein H4R34_003966 [Dimargaris verticillata]